jgi:hypothetical protein
MTKINIAMLSAALLTVSSAYAATVASQSGHAQNSADVNCFAKVNAGGVKNTCGGAFKNWTIPLTNTRTSTGAVTVKATANGTCGAPGTVCLATAPVCTVEHVNAHGVLLQAATKTLSRDTNTTTTVGTLSDVTTTSTLHMWCAIPGSDSAAPLGLMSVSW